VPLLCSNCGAALLGGDESAVFLCPGCGAAYEPGGGNLAEFPISAAAITSELAVSGLVRYVAVWRVAVGIKATTGGAWERVCKVAAPESPSLYIPGFTLMRPVMQRLGVRLTEAQPALHLTPGVPEEVLHRPSLTGVTGGGAITGLVGKGSDVSPRHLPSRGAPSRDTSIRGTSNRDTPSVPADGPSFDVLSPVVVSRKDARVLSHFVYLAVESFETRDILSVDYELEVTAEELILLPAVWDPRYIHESNWRLLLREFDGLVA
jgi:hypothetical protein